MFSAWYRFVISLQLSITAPSSVVSYPWWFIITWPHESCCPFMSPRKTKTHTQCECEMGKKGEKDYMVSFIFIIYLKSLTKRPLSLCSLPPLTIIWLSESSVTSLAFVYHPSSKRFLFIWLIYVTVWYCQSVWGTLRLPLWLLFYATKTFFFFIPHSWNSPQVWLPHLSKNHRTNRRVEGWLTASHGTHETSHMTGFEYHVGNGFLESVILVTSLHCQQLNIK